MYCFGEIVEVMEVCLVMNFYILFGGIVIFKNVKLLKIVV